MKSSVDLTRFLHRLGLRRLGHESAAGLWITSLPWPRATVRPLALEARPTAAHPLGRWPGLSEPLPRRLLLVADGGNRAPETLSLTEPATAAADRVMPQAEMELIERSPHPEFPWERHSVRIRWRDRSVALALGLRTAGRVHWWESCRLITTQTTAEGCVVEMGGAITRQQMTVEELRSYDGYRNPYLHRHNWLNGRLVLRLHSNGVCEVFAHHINSRFFDDGMPLDDVVPVIGFQSEAAPAQIESLLGAWDGSRTEFELGGVRFDATEASRLARPEQPGEMLTHGSMLVWQPYQGMELFGGICPKALRHDPTIFHAEQRIVPRGMARTIRFSFSLSDRSPRVARYLAPSWWFGACEEFQPDSLLPVSNEWDAVIDRSRQWVKDQIVRGGFEDGSVPRHAGFECELAGRKRDEPGWEGEMPHAQFLTAWRTGDAEDHACALRSAYHFVDCAVDHAAKLVKMHGYPPHAFALPMARLQGAIAAWLETGDPYLIETAQAVTVNSHWLHMNSWPRSAVGRDACYVRSLVLLHRYLGEDYFRALAREGARTVVESQRDDGSFGDQAGGTGIHQWGAYITKPWMGLLALNGVLDYLEMYPEDEPLVLAVKKFADWLLAERFDHDGVKTWSYQHGFNNQRTYHDPFSHRAVPLPTRDRWHHDTLGRLLAWAALRFNNPLCLDAWAESFAGVTKGLMDHTVAATLQFLPWVQARLWNARLTETGIEVRPIHFGARTPVEGSIAAPDGTRSVKWKTATDLNIPPDVSRQTGGV